MTKTLRDDGNEIARAFAPGFRRRQRLYSPFANDEADLPRTLRSACSFVTNKTLRRHPFDADGKGTSDLDLTLVGTKVMEYWDKDAFYIPALHTKPLCDEEPTIAIGLNKLRKDLQSLVGRPVNMQATANLVLYARDVLFGEPYFTAIEAEKE